MSGSADAVREHLAAGRGFVVDVRGHSMWPFLRDGQRVTVVRADRIRVGDVVLIADPWVLHRVIAIDGDRLTLKGDARPHPDGVIDRSEVLGRLDRPPCPALALLSRTLSPALAALARRTRLFLTPKSR